MKTDDILFGVFMGAAGASLFIMLITSLPGSYRQDAVDALERCEYNLPRDQNCIITAVPETTGE